MKNLYKIEAIRQPKTDRAALVQKIRLIRGLRLPTAQYVNVAKKLLLGRAVDDTRRIINATREGYKRVINSATGVEIVISRTLRDGVTCQYSYNPEKPGERREALQMVKERIRNHRRERKTPYDPLQGRKPGYFLRKYNESVLKKFKKPREDDRAQYVGVEIECIIPTGEDLRALIPFGKWVNVTSDGSIGDYDEDNEEGREIRVCMKREEVREVLPKIIETLVNLGARVNTTCGLHVHIDQRHATDPALNFQKLVRAQGLLFTVVPPSRQKNQYCKRNPHGRFHVARYGSRYRAINASAYGRHRTIEVRLFGGTLDATKIINWIEVLHGIIDGEVVNRCPKNFDTARRYWKLSDENMAWLKARQIKFGSVPSDTFEAQSDAADVPLEMAAQIERADGASLPAVIIDEATHISPVDATPMIDPATVRYWQTNVVIDNSGAMVTRFSLPESEAA